MSDFLTVSDADFVTGFEQHKVVPKPAAPAVAATEVPSTEVEGEAGAEPLTPTDDAGNVIPAVVEVPAVEGEVTDEAVVEGETEVAEDEVVSEDIAELLNKPITINGSQVTFTSVSELRQALENVAGYQRRYETSKADRELGAMFSKQGITSAADIAVLLDASKGNIGAVKSFLAKQGITVESLLDEAEEGKETYQPTDYTTDPTTQRFGDAVDAIGVDPQGAELLHDLTQFDDVSMQGLVKEPEALHILHTHKKDGTFAKVMGEVNRRKALNTIPADMPVIHAYMEVIANMRAAAAAPMTPQQALKERVVLKTETGKSKVTPPNPKAAAAAATGGKAAPVAPAKKVGTDKPVSDADFLKNWDTIKNAPSTN